MAGSRFSFVLLGFLATGNVAECQAHFPRFDVISIKPTPKDAQNLIRLDKCQDGGPYVSLGAPLLWSIEYAYRLNDTNVVGLPKWVESFSDAYDIQAKSDTRVTDEQCRQMLQGLLEDRFHLQIHRESRERNVYFLSVVKKGIKMVEVKAGALLDNATSTGGVRINGAVQKAPSEAAPAPGWSMKRLADYLAERPEVGRPIIDHTGLSGVYGFALDFSNDAVDRPSIFVALQDQLGLKLEPAKTATEVVIVDHIDRPGPN